MSNYALELFLLSTNLSQFKSKVLITKIFIERLNSIFDDHAFYWSNKIEEVAEQNLPVCTRTKTYGFISFCNQATFTEETFSLLQNAVQFLAMLLEKLEQEAFLINQKEHLNYLVEEKTKDLIEIQKLLQSQKDEIENQNKKHKLDKQKAEESEEKYRAIYENINDAVFIHKILHNGKPGNFLYFNSAAVKLLGYTSEELKSMSPGELDDPDSSIQYIPKVMKQLKEQGMSKFEAVQVAKDGHKIDIEVNAVVAKIGNDDYIVSVCRDITQKKGYQRILTEKEQFLSAIYTGISHSIFVVNVLEDGDFEYAGLNPQHEKVTGISSELIRGKKPADVLPEEAALNVYKRYAECVALKKSIAYEERLPFGGQETCWETILNPRINESGNVCQIIGTSQEITERKKAERLVQEKKKEIAAQNEELNQVNKELIEAKEKAEESEQRFRSLIENAPDGVVIIDESGKFKYVSPNAERLFGYSKDEAIGRSGDEYTHPDDLPLVLKTMETICANPGLKPTVQYRFKRKNGEFRWIETTFTNSLSDKAINGIVLNFSDITGRKYALEELRISKELLSETESIGKVGGWSFNIDTMEQKWTDEVYRIHEIEISTNPGVDAGINYYTRESRPIIEKALQQAIEHGENYDLELEIITAKGNTRTVHTIGKADLKNRRVYGFFQDITERKQTEKNLKESEERFRDLVDTINSGVAIYKVINDGTSGSDYIIQDFNQFALKHEKLKKEAVVGKSLKDIRPNIDEYGLIDIFRKVWKTGESAFFPAKIYIDENYTNYYENRVFKLPGGEIVAVYDDVSEREIAEKTLRKSEERYRGLLINLEVGVVVHSPDTSVVLCNNRASELLGLCIEQMKGKVATDPQWKFIYEDTTIILHNDYPVMRIFNSKKAIHNQILGVCREPNDLKWLMVSGYPVIEGDEISEIVISFIDITDQKQAEQALMTKMDELERFFKLTVGRELTMVELKKEVNNLLNKLGEDNKYKIVE
jgi:PAS domain S-box-containing protein